MRASPAYFFLPSSSFSSLSSFFSLSLSVVLVFFGARVEVVVVVVDRGVVDLSGNVRISAARVAFFSSIWVVAVVLVASSTSFSVSDWPYEIKTTIISYLDLKGATTLSTRLKISFLLPDLRNLVNSNHYCNHYGKQLIM